MRSEKGTALVLGVAGQDGAYLARLLLDRGYQVHGVTRAADPAGLSNLVALGIADRVTMHACEIGSTSAMRALVEALRPAEIYNLAAQSSVGLSFGQPAETIDSIVPPTLAVLEAMRGTGLDARFFAAGSGECFGDTGAEPAEEQRPFRPASPYGVAKAAAHWLVATYRAAYGLHASNGVLFSHESPLRPPRFVTAKIVHGARAVAEKRLPMLKLGNLDITRDWGWAEDYVEAMWRMLQADVPQDCVIATGVPSTLEGFAARAFACFGLDWRAHVQCDPSLRRPTDIAVSVGNPARARSALGWQPRVTMPALVDRLVEAALRAPPPAL
ncbi:MAG: GDP-mannose 4,6-dehydratase [Alphaproteobacteria bacterium]|nr:GDP-mannose 4,6-dehydratase [Alphaproteobacteria bacterium]